MTYYDKVPGDRHGKKIVFETLDGCICHSEISTVRLTDWSQLTVAY